MRETKFRGKSQYNGEWVYGSLVREDIILTEISQLWDDGMNGIWHIVDPKTVGQYTGLRDKNDVENGVEIYEGDIVVYDDLFNPFILHGTVKFIEGSWIIDSEEDDPVDLWSDTAEVKVIGNIYDNPEYTHEQRD